MKNTVEHESAEAVANAAEAGAPSAAPADRPMRAFAQLRRPSLLLSLGVLLTLGLYGALEAATGFHIYRVHMDSDWKKLMLAAYLLVLLAIFLAYFLSFRLRPLNAQTLRYLLMSETVNWAADATEDEVSAHREKAHSAITAQAIFIAICVFLIGSMPEALAAAQAAGDAWLEKMLNLSLATAMLSFILLLISIDAIETIFNRFREQEGRIVCYFYAFAAKRKYYGFILAFVALVFFVAGVSPVVAAFSVGAFIAVGYHFWFPDMSKDRRHFGEMRLVRHLLWSAPIVVILFDGF